jgi:hypothetical protein
MGIGDKNRTVCDFAMGSPSTGLLLPRSAGEAAVWAIWLSFVGAVICGFVE